MQNLHASFLHTTAVVPILRLDWQAVDSSGCYGTALLYKMGGRLQLSILGVVTYVLVVAHTSTPTVPTALGVPYGYAPAVTRVLGPTIAMSVTILKL